MIHLQFSNIVPNCVVLIGIVLNGILGYLCFVLFRMKCTFEVCCSGTPTTSNFLLPRCYCFRLCPTQSIFLYCHMPFPNLSLVAWVQSWEVPSQICAFLTQSSHITQSSP